MNYMSEVAKILGVELGERFHIKFNNGFNSKHHEDNEYYLCEHGVKLDKQDRACISSDMLLALIVGSVTIKKKPWKPNVDDQYYYVDEDGYACSDPWINSALDIVLYKLGNCYKTKEEAEANKNKWLSFYSSDEVMEVR